MNPRFPYPPDSAIGRRDSSATTGQRLAALLWLAFALAMIFLRAVPADTGLVFGVVMALWHLPPRWPRRR
jgi:hypothetical protein